ncbi:MAG TPA: RdgB/HAM1 family non-canonical purine NTP pyrophosphatase [Saprospiraceae bacterium]|nr:RdgB/HAM1 family non-canonical purine NTP pyrophosphatase [Saprospiraceae bacterium]HQU52861.1 RdgB/HAM1 family non-canonical purine NTP pyrophosphatase [Saprospiraceae bacterium]HRV83214.1 RdgB/HAM1 family non-canonical purine NTP pyrophosphatase [Saprospiraceae bacterium]
MRLIFATHNPNKVREIQAIVPSYIKIQSLAELDYNTPIIESGYNLEENALMKAKTVYDQFKRACFSEDTGLEIAALQGAPGVHSARYAGENATDKENVQKVLAQLGDEPNRKARFRTILALVMSPEEIYMFEGLCIGNILMGPQGVHGFGYDPIFQPNGYEKTFGEMTSSEKQAISHRTHAFEKMNSFLVRYRSPR